MLASSYVFLLVAGILANYRDWRMLGLTVLVGINVLIPIPSTTAIEFYSYCVLAETCLIIGALLLRTKATLFVVEIAIVLIVMHIMAYHIDGHPPLSPYRVLVKVCEYAQLCACIMFSKGFLPRFRNRML